VLNLTGLPKTAVIIDVYDHIYSFDLKCENVDITSETTAKLEFSNEDKG